MEALTPLTLQTQGFRPPPASRCCFLRRPESTSPANLGGLLVEFRATIFPPPLVGISRRALRSPRAASNSDNYNSGSHNSKDSDSPIILWSRPLLGFVVNNFLPLALVSGITFGFSNPTLGCLAHKYSLTKFSTCGIFFISGLTLRSRELGAAVEAWPAGLLGLKLLYDDHALRVGFAMEHNCGEGLDRNLNQTDGLMQTMHLGSILLFTPFFSRLILQFQLTPHEFVTGIAIFCCMPTTLSSGVALTHLAGANSALAMAMTVVSNLLGIMIVPLSLSKFIGSGAGASLPTSQLFKSLITTLLVPLVVGKIVRESFKMKLLDFVKPINSPMSTSCRVLFRQAEKHPIACGGVAEYADKNRRPLSMINSLLLSLVPWIQVSRSRSLLLTVKPAVFAIAVCLGTLLHLVLLALNTLAVQTLSVICGGSKSVFAKKENARAVIIVASQKTLPVTVAVVEQLRGALGEPGLLVIPCVASHINQIIIDSFLVNLWLRKDQQFAGANDKV